MDGFNSLAALGLALLGLGVFLGPIISLIGFLRARQLRETVAALEDTVRALDARVEGLARAQARMKTEAAADPATAPLQVPLATAPLPSSPPAPAVAAVPPVIPAAPRPVAPPAAPPAGPPPLPAAAARPPRATWPPPPAATTPVDTPGLPPRLPVGPPTEPPPPPAAPFDWESMLGIRGAAWLAGITFVIAALFFAKWSIDQGFFSPAIRVTMLAVFGTGALIWAELGLRKGYAASADAISGAGVVTLYITWFAAHTLYGLVGQTPAFIGMSVVTAVSAVIAIRHAALFTAILGVLGGLATPLLLSTGSDRPIGLFAYLSLLNLGYLFVARRQRWPVIAGLALVGTTLIELGWMAARLTPDTLVIAMIASAVLGGLYLWHALETGDGDGVSATQVIGYLGATVPFGLSFIFAADPRFVVQDAAPYGPRTLWPIVFANIVLLDVAAIAVGLWRLRPLVVISAVTTALAFLVWGIHLSTFAAADSLGAEGVPSGVGGASQGLVPMAPVLIMLALTATYNVLGRLAPGTGPANGSRPTFSWLGASGLAVAGGLYLFTMVLLVAMPDAAPALIVAITVLLFLVAVERTSVDVAPLLLPASGALLVILSGLWFEQAAEPGAYLGLLSFAHLWPIAFAIVGTVRDRQAAGQEAPAPWWQRADVAVLTSVALAYGGLHGAIDRADYWAPAPLFALVALDLALILLVAIRQSWTWLVPVAGAAGWLFATSWHVQHFSPETAAVAVGAELVIYLTFVALPFVLNAVRPRVWRFAVGAWLTSAFIGPAFFMIFRAAWAEVWGTSAIGLLSVLLAAVSVASLAGIGRVFRADTPDPREAARRLNYLALFAAIALGFVATAIAMQLDRQWITIGWALEAAAVFWVFGLVPHPGLKYFGLLLFGAVGLRLLANPEVLHYQPRGAPIVNWLLYTYGVPVLCTFAGAWLLRRAEARRATANASDYDWVIGDRTGIVPIVGGLGLILLFWLMNLEIADYFSTGRYVEIDFTYRFERDLTRSIAWGLYALGLLCIGLWRGVKGLRLASLLFLLLTVGKVFLYDLSKLTGIYRILSFVGLGTALIIFSLLYQRFFRKADR